MNILFQFSREIRKKKKKNGKHNYFQRYFKKKNLIKIMLTYVKQIHGFIFRSTFKTCKEFPKCFPSSVTSLRFLFQKFKIKHKNIKTGNIKNLLKKRTISSFFLRNYLKTF